MQVGSITFKVATGDITKEKADAIVNVSNETFNSYSGILLPIYNLMIHSLPVVENKGKYFQYLKLL